MSEATMARQLYKVVGTAQENLAVRGTVATLAQFNSVEVGRKGKPKEHFVSVVFTSAKDGHEMSGSAKLPDWNSAVFHATRNALTPEYPELKDVEAQHVKPGVVEMTGGNYRWVSETKKNGKFPLDAKAYADGLVFAAQQVELAKQLVQKNGKK